MSILQRFVAEQESTKSLLVANKILQSSIDQSEDHLKAARAHCETLQSQVSFMQNHFRHLEGHLAYVTDCLQRQPNDSGNLVDVSTLVSQIWVFRKQVIELEGVYQSTMQGQMSRELQLSTLRKAGLMKSTKRVKIKSKQRMTLTRLEDFECE